MKKEKTNLMEDVRSYLYIFGIVFFGIGFFFTMAKFLWETPIYNSFTTMMMGGMTLIVSELIRRLTHGKKPEMD